MCSKPVCSREATSQLQHLPVCTELQGTNTQPYRVYHFTTLPRVPWSQAPSTHPDRWTQPRNGREHGTTLDHPCHILEGLSATLLCTCHLPAPTTSESGVQLFQAAQQQTTKPNAPRPQRYPQEAADRARGRSMLCVVWTQPSFRSLGACFPQNQRPGTTSMHDSGRLTACRAGPTCNHRQQPHLCNRQGKGGRRVRSPTNNHKTTSNYTRKGRQRAATRP